MNEVFMLMLVAVCLMLIVMSIGWQEISYLVMWLKLKLMQLRKTKTDHTV